MATFQVREIPVAALRSAAWNANVVPAGTLKKIRASIEDFGVVENLVVRPHPDEAGAFEVISGNHRLQLYVDMRMDTAPCYVTDVDDARARILAQTLNRTRGDDDPAKKAALMENVLQTLTVDEALRYLPETKRSIEDLLVEYSPSRQLEDPDAIPPAPDEAESKFGEVYELGPHRLMCGDATNPEHVQTLLGEGSPLLLVTDPPYGVELDLTKRDEYNNAVHQRSGVHSATAIAGDSRADWSEAYELVPSLVAGYVWHAALHASEVEAGLERIGFDVAQQIIWAKPIFTMGRAHYHWQHEPCWYVRRRGEKVPWYGGRKQSTLWEASSPKQRFVDRAASAMPPSLSGSTYPADARGPGDQAANHPTQKPVALYSRPIRNHLRPGEALYDPFGGSGTAIIAAEQEGRIAYVMELDPRFCDVTRERFSTLFAVST